MEDLDWDRTACITAVRDRIWNYLSPASRFEGPGLLVAGALLQWPEAEASRLGELQFLLCRETGQFLGSLPQLMRKLATSSAPEEEWTGQRLRGPVEWSHTLALRNTTGDPNLFVTAPTRRVYQTPENELLVHVLDAIVAAAQRSGWDRITPRQEPARRVREHLAAAKRWQQNRMLSGIDHTVPAPRAVARVRSGRNAQRYAAVLAAYDKLTSLVERMDRQAVREAIEEAGLVTAEEPILFELLTTFRVIDALTSLGWTTAPLTLFHGHVHTTGHTTDGRQIDLWYQTTPRALVDVSHYRQVLTSHGFTGTRQLRPDITLEWTAPDGQQRWLLIECKLSQHGVRRAARQALADLLAYRADYDATLSATNAPHGLGVAWGDGLQPMSDSEVVLCTPDTLPQALQQIVT
jgi:hypothetical protein